MTMRDARRTPGPTDDPGAPPTRGRRALPRPLLRAAQAAVAVLLLVLLWRTADGPEAARALAAADPRWLLAGVALLVLHTVLAALRWRVTAAPLGIPLTRRGAIAEYLLAQLVNSTLPGGVLGDAGRAVRSRRSAGLLTAASAVVIERAVGQIALLLVLAVAFITTLAAPGGLEWPAGLAGVVGGALIAAAALGVVGAVAARRAGPAAGSRLGRLAEGLRRSVGARGVAGAQLALSAGTTASILTAFACCAVAVGAPLPLAGVLALVPLVLLAMLLPLSIGGWGVREGAAVAVLPLVGLAPEEALAASAAFGLMALVASLPGAAVLLAPRLGRTPSTTPDP